MGRSLMAVGLGWLGISMVWDGVPSLLVPYLAADSQISATALGLLTLVAIGCAALVQPVAGAWSDRHGRTPVIGAGIVAALGGLGLLATTPLLAPGTVLTLVGASIVQAGYQPLLPDRIDTRRRGRGAGLKGGFDVGGAFLAFLLLGFLLAQGLVLLAAATLALGLTISIVAGVGLLRRSAADRPIPDASADADSAEREPGALLMLVGARFLFLLGIFAVGRFLLLFIADRLGTTAEAAAGEAGFLFAVLALVTAGAAIGGGWLADRAGRAAVMVAGGLCAAAGIGLLPLADSVPAILAFGVAMAIGSGAFGAGSWAMQADLVAGPQSGRLLGLANLGTAGAAAAAGLFGPLIDAGNEAGGNGYAVAFTAAAVATGLGGLIGWRVGMRAAPTRAQRPAEGVN